MHLNHVYVLFTCSLRRVEGPHGQVEMNVRGQFGFGLKNGGCIQQFKGCLAIPCDGPIMHPLPWCAAPRAKKHEAIDEQNTCTLLPYLIFPGQLQSSCAFSGRTVRFSIPSSSRQHSAARPSEAQSSC